MLAELTILFTLVSIYAFLLYLAHKEGKKKLNIELWVMKN